MAVKGFICIRNDIQIKETSFGNIIKSRTSFII